MDLLKMVMDDDWTRERLLLIKQTCANDATEAELAQYVWRAKVYGLDPLLGELVYQKYKSKDGPSKVAFITTRDGYLKVAQMETNFMGLKSVTVKEGDLFDIDFQTGAIQYKPLAKPGARILGAVAVAFHKLKIPVVIWAPFDEYYSANASSKTWQKYPSAMVMKVAEVGALRRQFNISGLVAQEEGLAATTIVPEQEGYLPPLGIPTSPKAPEEQAETTETQQPKQEETKTEDQQPTIKTQEETKVAEGAQPQQGDPPASETPAGQQEKVEQTTTSAKETHQPKAAEKELSNPAAPVQEAKLEEQTKGKQKQPEVKQGEPKVKQEQLPEQSAAQQQTAQDEGPVYELRGARAVQSQTGTNALQLALKGLDDKIIQAYAMEGPIMDRVTSVVDQGQGTKVIVSLEKNGKFFEIRDIKLAQQAEGDRNAA
ncbi:MAG: recombinase RecT [Bacillota bacterium]